MGAALNFLSFFYSWILRYIIAGFFYGTGSFLGNTLCRVYILPKLHFLHVAE